MSDFVVLKTCMLSIEAEMLRGRLESDGIRCFLEGDKAASVVGDFNRISTSWSNPLGGTKVLVSSDDLDVARAILKEIEYSNSDDSNGDETVRTSRRAGVWIWLFWSVVVLVIATFLVTGAFSRR